MAQTEGSRACGSLWALLHRGKGVAPWPKAQNHSHNLASGSKSTHKADALLLSLGPQVIKGTVNIQVGDVNDNAPQFHNQPYSVRIPEVGIISAWLLALPSVATLALWLPPQSWPLMYRGCPPALDPHEVAGG